MVDPLEAKRLAAKQMQEIQAKKKFKVKGISCHFKIMSYDLSGISGIIFGITGY